MNIHHVTNTMLVAATALIAAAPVAAQDHEPMRLTGQNRGNWVEIDDSLWGVEEYTATFNGTGSWADSGERSNSGASGTSSQWTRIDEDFIGGFFHSSVSSFGGLREEAGNVLWAEFEVDRTGRMHATASFGGHFSDDLEEVMGSVRLTRVDEDGHSVESLINWTHLGENADSAEREEYEAMLLRPGNYRVWIDTFADVHGIEIWPDLGSLDLFASFELEQLPGCGEPGAGSCGQANQTPSCDDASCCDRVCEVDPYCCDNQWDSICVGRAADDCGPCPGDLNGDGTVDGADQGLLFAAWGPHPPTFVHPADLNTDGVVNGLDLGILFSHWGDC